MIIYRDRQGQPIARSDWTQKVENFKYTVVSQEHIDGWFISTVWLGIDSGIFDGPPQIFETMIFPPDSETGERFPDLDHWQERHATEDEARAGHERAMAKVREQLGGAA